MIVVNHETLTPHSFLNDENKKAFISNEQSIIHPRETLLIPLGFNVIHKNKHASEDTYVLVFEIHDSLAQKGLQLKTTHSAILATQEKMIHLEVVNIGHCVAEINKGDILGAFIIRKERTNVKKS